MHHENQILPHQKHSVDFCVVGAGLSGMCAAIAAARRGLRVAIMHDRPMPGGNCSPEIRMWVWGARGKNNRETGIIEELILKNRYRNPSRNYSIWGSILYEAVRFEENITLLLNCSCNDLEMNGERIQSVTGWQTTTQTWHTVEADLFADCSGDISWPPFRAQFRVGQEARSEYGESIAPEVANDMTMGMSILIQARETNSPQTFIPPDWAETFECDSDLPDRDHNLSNGNWMWNNFWWIEAGGDRDGIGDTEEIRDELLSCAYGVWDHIKNKGTHKSERWELDWVGFLPGKRESRRYQGDYTINENDVRRGGAFDDVVAYAGWPMDDHHPKGFRHKGTPSTLYDVPTPWGIPYRSLYSCNVTNLFCAGRNISASHVAFSSTRVMATCAILGQAVGTAAVIASRESILPREVGRKHIQSLQQMLLEDDCYLPGLRREIAPLSRNATLTASEGNPEALRNGVDRPVGDQQNGWSGSTNAWIEYAFSKPQTINEVRLVFDSDLNRPETTMLCKYPLQRESAPVPETLLQAFRIEVLTEEGQWKTVYHEENNYQRLVRVPLEVNACAVRFVPERTWGSEQVILFAFEVS